MTLQPLNSRADPFEGFIHGSPKLVVSIAHAKKDTGNTKVSVYPQSITRAELRPKVMMDIRWLGAKSTDGT